MIINTDQYSAPSLQDPTDTYEAGLNILGSTKRELTSEEQLWIAVLRRGIEEFKNNLNKYKPPGKRLFYKALDWIFNDDNPTYFGSFDNLCVYFEQNPKVVRYRLIHFVKKNYVSPENQDFRRVFRELTRDETPGLLFVPLKSVKISL